MEPKEKRNTKWGKIDTGEAMFRCCLSLRHMNIANFKDFHGSKEGRGKWERLARTLKIRDGNMHKVYVYIGAEVYTRENWDRSRVAKLFN